MKTSYIYLILSLILIVAALSLGSQNLSRDKNEICVQYEFKLSSEKKYNEKVIYSEAEAEFFLEEKLELETWMTDLSKWK